MARKMTIDGFPPPGPATKIYVPSGGPERSIKGPVSSGTDPLVFLAPAARQSVIRDMIERLYTSQSLLLKLAGL